MGLPINIEYLINGNTIEWERIEFKAGWNPVYHKSYELQSPIEVQVWHDKIEILSFPGAVPPVDANVLKTKHRIVAREYRNRRIGDFLKELQLTEGRGTGFPAIYDALEANGSPKPVFETDEESTYFLTTILAHPLAEKNFAKPIKFDFHNFKDIVAFANSVNDQANDQVTNGATNGVKTIIISCKTGDCNNFNQSTNGATNGANDQVTDQATDQAENNIINCDIDDCESFNIFTDQATDQATDQVKKILDKEVHSKVEEMLKLLQMPMLRAELFEKVGLTNHYFNIEKYLTPLLSLNWVEMEFPDKKTSPKQTYKITQSGKRVLWLLSGKKE